MPETMTAADYMNDAAKFSADVLRAIKAFARSKPWQGTEAERQDKFRPLNDALAAAYGIAAPELVFLAGHGCAGQNGTLAVGNLSVVSYLHGFARVGRGMAEAQATGWSLNLFKRCFPRSFARCRFVGPFLVRDEDADAIEEARAAAELDAAIRESAENDEV